MWLGIDIGTGGTRALLVDRDGTVRAGYTSPHEDMRMERPLWAEQAPGVWLDRLHRERILTRVPHPGSGRQGGTGDLLH